MLPYWLLFGLFAAGALRYAVATVAPAAPQATPYGPRLKRARRMSLLTLAALVPTLMIGLRFEVGTDWLSYLRIFRFIAREGLWAGLERIDPGYALLNWLVAAAGFEIWAVNLICAVLFMFGLMRFASIQPNPWLTIAAAVPFLIIGVGMGFTRQAVAIGFALAGLVAATNASFTRFLLWTLAGALFHRSAVILIPIIAIAHTRNRFQSFLIILVGCLLGYFVLSSGQGIEHFESQYVARTYEAQGALARLAMNVPPALILLAFLRRFAADEFERVMWRNFAVIAVVTFVAWFFTESTAALDRIALYIIPLQLFVFSRLPWVFGDQGRRQSVLLVSAVLAYSAAVQFVWLNYSNNARNWIPYQVQPLDSLRRAGF